MLLKHKTRFHFVISLLFYTTWYVSVSYGSDSFLRFSILSTGLRRKGKTQRKINTGHHVFNIIRHSKSLIYGAYLANLLPLQLNNNIPTITETNKTQSSILRVTQIPDSYRVYLHITYSDCAVSVTSFSVQGLCQLFTCPCTIA